MIINTLLGFWHKALSCYLLFLLPLYVVDGVSLSMIFPLLCSVPKLSPSSFVFCVIYGTV